MKRKKQLLVTVLCFLIGMSLCMTVKAQETAQGTAQTETDMIELTEEDNYNPLYYQPVGTDSISDEMPRAGMSAASMSQFESTVVNALKQCQPIIDVSSYQIYKDDIKTYYFQVLNNHPELFFVVSAFRYSYMPANGMIVAIAPMYENNMTQARATALIAELDAAANKAVKCVAPGMKDYEKALTVHDWLAVQCEYDKANYDRNMIPTISHTAYGALVNKVAVCDGYADAYKYIMNKLGVNCTLVTSDYMAHAWNMVQIGGRYYHVDVTWDDPTWDSIGKANHNFFLLSDMTISDSDHGHYNWESVYQALDTTYDNALWTKAQGSIIYHNGVWYYTAFSAERRAVELLKTTNILAGSETAVFDLGVWKVGQGAYWTGSFAYPQVFRDGLVFNGPKNIYVMPFATEKVSVLLTPGDTALLNDVYNIYGFKMQGAMLYYSVQSTPDLAGSQTQYIKAVPYPGSGINGKVSLSGEARCGSTLKAVVQINGTAGNLDYQWYVGNSRIEGAVTASYGVKTSDIGKKITVKISSDNYTGELTCQTNAVLKAKPAKPAAITLKGYKGATLSNVALPKGYTWKNGKTVMSKTGTISYPAMYCPDTSLYETMEVSVLVKVTPLKKGVAFADAKTQNKYKITKITSKTAEVSFNGTADKKIKKVTIPSTVKFSGRTFKVTSIAKNAMKSHKSVQSVTIGTNVTKIDSGAFYNCKKLNTMTIKSTKIKTWGKNCIKGIYKKATIKCPKGKRGYYRNKLTKTTGYQKNLKIK